MTKDEIKLVTFIVLALLIGTASQWWDSRSPRPEPPPPTPAPRGWAKPPYVFKNRKQMEKTAADLKAVDSPDSAGSR